jgi:hypothetical protein
MLLADRPLPSQPAEMSRYSANEEITLFCGDYLVELRGFELMAIASSGAACRGFGGEFFGPLRWGLAR